MKTIYAGLGAIAASLVLAGCTMNTKPPVGSGATASGESISIAVGPCFGFCPVYEAKIADNGTVIFEGARHTEVLGERRREAGAGVYQSLASDLAPFRPADGTTQRVECEAAISDTSIYTITWHRADGREAVATHPRGCSGGPGQSLDAILGALPERLGIAAWARQVTRPGESRG